MDNGSHVEVYSVPSLYQPWLSDWTLLPYLWFWCCRSSNIVGGLIGREGTYPETFMAGFVICGFLEYMTSFYMGEKCSMPDGGSSSKPMNLHGRIWIGNLILFGLASVVIVKWIAPHYFDFIETWDPFILSLFAWIILACVLF